MRCVRARCVAYVVCVSLQALDLFSSRAAGDSSLFFFPACSAAFSRAFFVVFTLTFVVSIACKRSVCSPSVARLAQQLFFSLSLFRSVFWSSRPLFHMTLALVVSFLLSVSLSFSLFLRCATFFFCLSPQLVFGELKVYSLCNAHCAHLDYRIFSALLIFVCSEKRVFFFACRVGCVFVVVRLSSLESGHFIRLIFFV